MAKCTGAASIYGDICFTPGAKSLPGVRGWVFGIAKRDILGWPTIGSETPKTMDAVAKYTGDFKLASDKKWHKIGLIPNESQLQVESQGTYGSKTFKVTGTAVIPGTEEAATGYISLANNDEMVYLFIQRNGKARMVGSLKNFSNFSCCLISVLIVIFSSFLCCSHTVHSILSLNFPSLPPSITAT